MRKNKYIPTLQHCPPTAIVIQGLDTSFSSFLNGASSELGNDSREHYYENQVIEMLTGYEEFETPSEKAFYDNLRAKSAVDDFSSGNQTSSVPEDSSETPTAAGGETSA